MGMAFRGRSLEKGNTGIWTGSVTVDPASAGATATLSQAVTLNGVKVGDMVVMNPPAALEDDLIYAGAYVSDANEVTIRLYNPTGGAIDGAALSWGYAVVRAG